MSVAALGAIEAELMGDYSGNKYVAMSVDGTVVVRVEQRAVEKDS